MKNVYNLKCGLNVTINEENNEVDIINTLSFLIKNGIDYPPFKIPNEVLKEASDELRDILYKKEMKNEK